MTNATVVHCPGCGWPTPVQPCESCGLGNFDGNAATDDEYLGAFAGARPEDYPGLESAFAAWAHKDASRLVGQCLTSLGVTQPIIRRLSDGSGGWSFVLNSAVVYLRYQPQTTLVSIESPVLRMPAKQAVPLMRTLLELNQGFLRSARFALRDNLVVLTFTEELANLPPPRLAEAIRELAIAADDLDDMLAAGFSARMVGPDAQRQQMDWRFLGEPAPLRELGVGAEMPTPIAQHIEADATPTQGQASAEVDPHLATRLAAGEAIVELAREADQLLTSLSFMKRRRGAEGFIARSLVYRLELAFGEVSPAAVAFAGTELSSVLTALPAQESNDKLLLVARRVCHELNQHRGVIEGDARYDFESFAEPARAAAHFRALVSAVEALPSTEAVKRFTLIGVAAEALVRASVLGETMRVRRALETAEAGQDPARDLERLRYNLQVLVR